jgi:hypothetical protein
MMNTTLGLATELATLATRTPSVMPILKTNRGFIEKSTTEHLESLQAAMPSVTKIAADRFQSSAILEKVS